MAIANKMKINKDLIIEDTDVSLEKLSEITIEEFGDKYIKYSNGIMIQWGSVTGSAYNNTQVGQLYYTGYISLGYFPVSYIEKPYCICQNMDNRLAVLELMSTSSTIIGGVYLGNATNNGSLQSYNIVWLAIGKWK